MPDPIAGRVVIARKSGVEVDGQRICDHAATLRDGYVGCAAGSYLVNLETRLHGEGAWRLEADDDLPLVALSQVLTSLYRGSVTYFTLVSGTQRREVANRRDANMLLLSVTANENMRFGVDQGAFALGPTCSRRFVPIDDTLSRCLSELAVNPRVVIELDALGEDDREHRTVSWLWSLLARIDASFSIALR